MQLKIKLTSPTAVLPTYATPGAACFDIRADEAREVLQHNAATFSTGLAVEVPEGHALLIFSRSGHGFNHDLRLANCVGVIDSDYRGEIGVRISNDKGLPFWFERGDRIAQAMLVQIPRVEMVEVAELSTTARGADGFGSTGNN